MNSPGGHSEIVCLVLSLSINYSESFGWEWDRLDLVMCGSGLLTETNGARRSTSAIVVVRKPHKHTQSLQEKKVVILLV